MNTLPLDVLRLLVKCLTNKKVCDITSLNREHYALTKILRLPKAVPYSVFFNNPMVENLYVEITDNATGSQISTLKKINRNFPGVKKLWIEKINDVVIKALPPVEELRVHVLTTSHKPLIFRAPLKKLKLSIVNQKKLQLPDTLEKLDLLDTYMGSCEIPASLKELKLGRGINNFTFKNPDGIKKISAHITTNFDASVFTGLETLKINNTVIAKVLVTPPKNLQHLKLSYSKVDVDFSQVRLKTLNAKVINLKKIPYTTINYSELTILKIGNIPEEVFPLLINLQELHIDDIKNRITHYDTLRIKKLFVRTRVQTAPATLTHLKCHTANVKNLPNLHLLLISIVDITVIEMSNLRQLTIEVQGKQPENLRSFGKRLSKLVNLKDLQFRGLMIGKWIRKLKVETLEFNMCTLQSLDLHRMCNLKRLAIKTPGKPNYLRLPENLQYLEINAITNVIHIPKSVRVFRYAKNSTKKIFHDGSVDIRISNHLNGF